ncbi:metallophosphoesterase [Hoeflea sp.]|uniref:metallophosphoesterase family protein n=1 Tax=Hoeflea sp. TaxID=1940281 RepID=UPI0019C6FA52|nr:metallophosphoesterase [Hoeflea sp.]MBC7282196.1 metallophosphoesterase [Hoeflea sp.]
MRILQFTDLHFRQALPGHSGHAERLSRHGPALLSRLAELIAAEAPDIVAFTGDVIDAPHDLLHGTGDETLRRFLRAAVEEDYKTMRAWLDGLGRPWMIAPGNHDFRPAFEAVFGDAPRKLEISGVRLHAYFDWEVTDHVSERLGDERARFDRALAEAGTVDWTVHLQHFLIWPMVVHGYPMRYRDADALRDRLASSPARHLVLCGHFHEGTGIVPDGKTLYAVCPSLTEAPHRYRVFDLGPETCELREETMQPGPLAGSRILLVDRGDVLAHRENMDGGDFDLRADAAKTLEAVRDAGFSPVILSPWNDDQSVHLDWPDMLKKHDRLFVCCAEAGIDQATGLLIAIEEGREVPARMPSEPLSRLAELADRAAAFFGVASEDVWLMSSSASRRQLFGVNRSVENVAALSAANPDLKG